MGGLPQKGEGGGFSGLNDKPDTEQTYLTMHSRYEPGFQNKFQTGYDEEPAKLHIRRYTYNRRAADEKQQ